MSVNHSESVHLLLISRHADALAPLWKLVEANSWIVQVATSGWHALEIVQSGNGPELILLDLLPGDTELAPVLRWLRRVRPSLRVIVLGDGDDVQQRANAARLGTHEYLAKPIDVQELGPAILRQLVACGGGVDVNAGDGFEKIDDERFFLASTPIMRRLRAQVQFLAQASVPVLIVGEAGSGKETVARLLHKLSPRSASPFRTVNCAAAKEHLLSELFGRGDDALSSPPGKLEVCRQGTLFLRHVTEMHADVQARLLDALQKEGPASSIPQLHSGGSARIVATTVHDADSFLEKGRFREDLYYGLSTFVVHVPSLRYRGAEVVLMLDRALQQMANYYGLPHRSLSSAAREAVQCHSWPGNLTELEAFAKRYLVVGDDSLDELEPMPRLVFKRDASRRQEQPGPVTAKHEEQRSATESLGSLVRSVKGEAEKSAIAIALKKTQWNRKAAAGLLRISYRALLYKIQQYQITPLDTAMSADVTYPAVGFQSPEN